MVSRNELGTSYEGEMVQPLILPQLGSKQAVQFFLDVLGEDKISNFDTKEIVDLILNSPYYPLSKVFPNMNYSTIPAVLPDGFRDELLK